MEGVGRSWEEMEGDCLTNIFQRLGLDDMTLAVPFVCKSWHKASLDPLCWMVLNFRALDFFPWSHFAKRFRITYCSSSSSTSPPPPFSFAGFMRFVLSRSRGCATDIKFPLNFGPSIDDLVYASNECPRLKTVVLPKLMRADEKIIPEVIRKWKHLEWLEMESKPSSFLQMISDSNKLVGLKMHGGIRKEDTLAFATLLPKLKYLDLSKSYLEKEELLQIVGGCEVLERLVVKNCLGFEADDEVLRRAERIKSFEHEGSKLLDGSGYETDEFDLICVPTMF